MPFTNDTKPNFTTPLTWATIVPTWAEELRTWATAFANVFYSPDKPTNSFSSDSKPSNSYTNDSK